MPSLYQEENILARILNKQSLLKRILFLQPPHRPLCAAMGRLVCWETRGWGGGLICSICPLAWCKDFHQGWFPNSNAFNDWLAKFLNTVMSQWTGRAPMAIGRCRIEVRRRSVTWNAKCLAGCLRVCRLRACRFTESLLHLTTGSLGPGASHFGTSRNQAHLKMRKLSLERLSILDSLQGLQVWAVTQVWASTTCAFCHTPALP